MILPFWFDLATTFRKSAENNDIVSSVWTEVHRKRPNSLLTIFVLNIWRLLVSICFTFILYLLFWSFLLSNKFCQSHVFGKVDFEIERLLHSPNWLYLYLCEARVVTFSFWRLLIPFLFTRLVAVVSYDTSARRWHIFLFSSVLVEGHLIVTCHKTS